MNATRSHTLALVADRLNAAEGIPVSTEPPVAALMAELGARSRASARALANASSADKDRALRAMAARIRASAADIFDANAADVAAASAKGQPAAIIDRLRLDPARLEAIAAAIESIAALPDPVGRVLARFDRPNGLEIERVATPLGVIGVIFESRPNVTADAGALCLKAGNAAILRAGSDSFDTSHAMVAAMAAGLAEAGLPANAIQLVPTRDRAAGGAVLARLDGNLNVILPRGGKRPLAGAQAGAPRRSAQHARATCRA